MSTLHFKIITPEKNIFDGDVEVVTATTQNGEIGIMPYHTNLITTIIPGEVRITKGTRTESLVTGGGLLQMNANKLTLITDSAENLEEINLDVVEEAKERAIKAIEQRQSDEEYAIAAASLEKALAKLSVKRRHSHH